MSRGRRTALTAQQQASLSACVGVVALGFVLHISSVCLSASPIDEPTFASDAVCLRIDPNTASKAELMLLPGIGETLASRIVEWRETAATKPAFQNAADLQAVRGIGPGRAGAVRPHLRFPPASASEEGAAQ